MRALLLILIGGGLLWLLIQGFGPSLAKDSGASNSGGTMLREDLPATPDTPASAPENKGSEASSAGSPAVVPAPAKPEVATSTPPAPAPEARAAGSGLSEAEVAAQLLHQTDGFVDWLAKAKLDLSPGRREFARALALQLNGRGEEAGALTRELGSAKDLAPDEAKLLEFWPQGAAFALPKAGASGGSLLLRAAGLASAERAAAEALASARWPDAVEGYSRLLLEELRSPWEPDPQGLAHRAEGLTQAQRGHRWNRKGSWSALELKVNSGDSLISLRKRALQERSDLVTCTGLIARANQLQGETLQPGQTLRIPTGKPHVLVDLSARWLFFMLDDEVVGAWPVGVGKPGNETPPGRYTVGEKSVDPTWFRAGKQPVSAGDPSNPLGTRWIAWVSASGEKTHLGFHGTRDPESIGQDESEGCIRMLNRQVEELYEILPRNSEILVQP